LDLVGALKDSSRSATGGESGQRSRSALVVAEIAITLVLAFAAGLAAAQPDRGRKPPIRASFPSTCWRSNWCCPPRATRARRPSPDFYDRLRRDLRGLPGVTAVGAVNCPPSAGDCGDWFYSILDRPAPQPGEVPIALFNTADRDYFGAMRIPLREGRAFSDTDRRAAPRVAIVNETFARKWWPKNRPWDTASNRAVRIGTGPSTKSWAWPAMSARWAWAPSRCRRSICPSRSRRRRPWW
jgi:putative ABC transport system permease protein